MIDENDILFKREYADSSILYESNTKELKEYFYNLNKNNSILGGNNIQTVNFIQAHNLPFPSYVTATNIPILQNISLNNYFDILHSVDTSDPKDLQDYLVSVFRDNIDKLKNIKNQNLKKMFYSYDMISRKNIIYKTPIYGSDLFTYKGIKLILAIEHINNLYLGGSGWMNRPILFSKNSEIYERSIVNSMILNRGFKGIYGKFRIYDDYDSLNNRTYEGFSTKKMEIDESESQSNQIQQSLTENNNNKDIEIQIEVQQNEDVEMDNKTLAQNPTPIKKVNFKNIEHIKEVKDEFLEFSCSAKDSIHFLNSDTLQKMILTPPKMLNMCDDLMTNFRIHIPKVISKGPQMISSSFKTDVFQSNNKYRILYNNLNRIPNVQKYFSMFKIISFPDKNLVEFDSGKLIKLANLLKRLKQNKSKVLIFTQMTRMLDILEIFLNLHGYTYVRLDGSTKVEVRQQVVDKFNNDSKVFCFISSTRSGGIGLNLTGADSIVFFDTDWNPAMDKQAQDRCHRIGQTRTVHIYRLITLSTIEENIFKKSIQKRELNYIIMEDGKFDMENFNKINFKSIVAEEHLIKDESMSLVRSTPDDKIKKLLEFENLQFENEEEQKNLEQLLIRIEDQEDVQALKNASKEMLGEYEKENDEQNFFNNDDVNI